MAAPEKRGNRRTSVAIAARAAIVTTTTTPSRTQRPEPADLSGTSQARLANVTNTSDGSIRGRMCLVKP